MSYPQAPQRPSLWLVALLAGTFALVASDVAIRLSKPPRIVRVAPPRDRPRFDTLTKRVVVVIVDGWRYADSTDPVRMPAASRLGRRGSHGLVLAGMLTFTQPALKRMFTGEESSLRDVVLNQADNRTDVESIFTVLDVAGIGYGIAAFAPALPQLFGDELRPGTVEAHEKKTIPRNMDDVADDDWVLARAFQFMTDAERRLVVIHLGGLDMAAHLYSPRSLVYGRMLTSTNDRIARLAAAMDLEHETLILIGDHGVDDQGNHGGPERVCRETAYVAIGAGIGTTTHRFEQQDVVNLVALLLGVCPPSSSEGAPQTSLLRLDRTVVKSRTDACLRVQIAAQRGPRWEEDPDVRAYFALKRFTPAAEDTYRAIVSREQPHNWSKGDGALGALVLALGVASALRWG